MSPANLSFLGQPRFTRGERPVLLPSAKAVALLGYLAATHSAHTRDHLLALLWPESLPEAARKNLRNTLWTIRRVLGDETLRAEDDRLALAGTLWVDVWELEKIAARARPEPPKATAQVLALYRGPFLDGLSLVEAPDFEIWLTTERERLGQIYMRLLSAAIDTHRAEGNWQEVIDLARRALAHDPLQEPVHRVLMEAHARLGARAEALRQYDALRALLDRELGVEPLPDTEELRAAVAGGGLQPVAIPLSLTPGERRQLAAGDGPPTPPFVGRRSERGLLDAEFRRAAGGEARIVLLAGELGIGKSRLWQEWSRDLPRDATVLETRCLDSTQALPFAPLIELFGRHTCLKALLTPASPVPRIWLAEVARLLPELLVAQPDLPPPPVLPPEEARHRIFEAFTQYLHALTARPLVFFIDDLHWADRATLDWLGYLVHRLRARPLLLVAAYRPEDEPPALPRLFATWNREGLMRRVAVQRLSDAEAAELVTLLGGDPALAQRAQAQSAGNPYFLIEFCRAAPGDIPPVLAELVRARLERLPASARQVLQAAAVLETEFDFTTLRRTSGRGEEETLDALDVLLAAAVLVERDGYYSFTHPLVASVVRGGLSGARRAFLHRRAAAALQTLGAGRLSQIAGRLAIHHAEAGDHARAAHYAEMAAERALSLAAADEAVAFYRQALELEPTPARQLGLGRALLRQGDLPGARSAFERALHGFEAQADRRRVAEACLELSNTYLPSGRPGEAEAWAMRSLRYLDPDTDPATHALVHFLIGASRLQSGRALAEAEQHLVEAARLAAEHDLADVAARSRFELGNLLAERGDLADALQAYRESIVFARVAGNQFQEVLGHNNLAYHALLLGDLATARAHIDDGVALAEREALVLPLQYLYSTRGELALVEKRWDEADGWFRRALAAAERSGNLRQAANDRANRARVARGRGDLERAVELLEQARTAVAGLAGPHLRIQIDLWLAELYLERRQQQEAGEALARAEEWLAGSDRRRLRAWAEQLRQQLVATTRV